MAGTGTAHLREEALLEVRDLYVTYPLGRGRSVHAVSGISFDVVAGETLGIVGESGCGKSSAARAVMGLRSASGGTVRFDGTELTDLKEEPRRVARARMEMIFQDPISSLNPRRRVHDIVAEPIKIWEGREGARDEDRLRQLLTSVGLNPEQVWDRRPSEMSGGQCQRVSIARALAVQPQMIICDEPVSALDVSVQAQILNLLEDAKDRYGLSLVFIAHDLAVVNSISDRILVMYLGKVCEVAGPASLVGFARHPYTRLLLASVPEPDPDIADQPIDAVGELPSPIDPPLGCRFHTRCPRATARCSTEEPVLRPMDDGHWVACHHPYEEPVSLVGRRADSRRPDRTRASPHPAQGPSNGWPGSPPIGWHGLNSREEVGPYHDYRSGPHS